MCIWSATRPLFVVLPLLMAACGGSSSDGSSSEVQTLAGSALVSAATGSGTTTGSSTTTAGSETGSPSSSPARYAYVGGAQGIYCFAVDAVTGLLTGLEPDLCDSGGLIAVATDPQGAYAYAANRDTSTIRAYSIDPATGALVRLATPEVAADPRPLSLIVDPSGRFVYTGNYDSSTISAFAIDSTTGALTAVAGSPFVSGPSPNAETIDPSGKFLYTANEGFQSKPASISAFTIDPKSGALTAVAGSPFAAGASVMNVAIDPAGRFLFAANTQTIVPSVDHHGGSVAVFAIDPATGALSAVPGSPFAPACVEEGPPFMCDLSAVAVDQSGSYLYGSFDNEIVEYSIDAATGALTQLSGSPVIADGQPYSGMSDLSVQNGILYATDNSSGMIVMFAIDPSSGQLNEINGSPVAASGSGTLGIYTIAFTP